MRLVVDSNILFAALIRDSTTRKILLHLDYDFFIIKMNYEEIKKYTLEMLEKSKINEASFNIVLDQLLQKCILIEEEKLLNYWEEAKKIMLKIDSGDVPFIAAALATGADIWSDDLHFNQQKKIKVWKTKDLIKFL
ncbi:MAG: PIN domain-containing protein [Nanoarchaeota archaeon]